MRLGAAWTGKAGEAWPGLERLIEDSQGKHNAGTGSARQAVLDMAIRGRARQGKAG